MTKIICRNEDRIFRSTPPSSKLLPAQGCVELQRDAAGKVHPFHTHPVDEILVIVSGRLNSCGTVANGSAAPVTRYCCLPAPCTNPRPWMKAQST